MYMCDLFASISFQMCWCFVVFAGVQSLRSNYNIRHENLHEILTFSHIKLMRVWAVDNRKYLWYYIIKYEIFTVLWATNSHRLQTVRAANPRAIARGFEQYINCEISVMAVVLRAVFLWVRFYGVMGDAIIKNANFPNLQRTKNER